MAGRVKKGKDLLRSAVRDYEIKQDDDVNSIFSNMANSGGFESRNLADGVDILRRMIDDQNCTKFMSFVGALMSTGARGIIHGEE
jgi:deoxyhypusine synthase